MKILTIPSSGKLGLSVRMNGRYGQVERTWVVPSNPKTEAQVGVRSRFTEQAMRWDTLTEAQRAAWTVAAASVRSNSRCGSNGPLTGLQYFVQINCVLAQFGQEVVTAPPSGVVLTMPAPANLTITNTGGVIALKLTTPSDPGENTVVRGSAPQKQGVTRAPNVVILGMCPAPVTGSANITGLYTARYGVPPVGKKVFVAVQMMSNGVLGPERTFSAIVPAS